MRIAFFIGCMRRGGAERVISILANEYAEKGWDVDILMLLANQVGYDLHPSIHTISLVGASDSYIKNAISWNVICQGQIYPILKFLSHNTHIFIKIAKETVVCCLFCRIGYEQRKARNATGNSASLRVNFLSFGCIFLMLRDRMCFLFGTLE